MNILKINLFFQKLKQSYLLILLSLVLVSCNIKNQKDAQNQNQEQVESETLRLSFKSGVRSIFEDSKGLFWFGSDDEGVCFFDGKSFKYFTVKDGLSDNQIRAIQEDEKGNIWFGTGDGVSSFDGEKIINHTANNIISTNVTLPNIWTKTENDLWFNVRNTKGVYQYDGESLKYLAFPETKHLINVDHLYLATGFSKGLNNKIWIATYGGVFGYDGEEFTIINDESLGYTSHQGFLHIRSILEDSKGNLWIGNNGIGVLKYDGDTTINFSELQGLISENSGRNGGYFSPLGSLEHVFAIEEDKDGNIWFGDRDTGAWKYDGESMTHYTVDDQLQSQMIYDIYRDKNGRLLFGMLDGGVYVFNENSFERKY